MDRQYLRPHRVNVYPSADAKNQGLAPLRQAQIVPHSFCGYDNYLLNGRMLPGYRDERDSADACVFLDSADARARH